MTSVLIPGRDAAPRMTSYEDERAGYRVDVPERFNAVIDIIERWAGEEPNALALLSLDANGDVIDSHTVGELALESRRAARALLALGVNKGEPLFLMLPRSSAWYFVMLGAMRIGAIPMPGTPQLTSKDIAYRIERGLAVAAVTDETGAQKVDAAGSLPVVFKHRICWSAARTKREGWHDLYELMDKAGDGDTPKDPTSKDDPLLIFFTSGTVSFPKMVQHRQSYALGHVGTARFWHDLRPGDRHWTVSDTGWAKAAWGGLFGQWHERATVIQVALGRPNADTILSTISRHRITSFCAPPTLFRMLVLSDLKKFDLSALRHCTSAGEPLNPEVIRIWQEGTGGLTIYDGYGQTESTCLVANFRCLPVRPGSMGKPVPGYTVDIVDDDGKRVADDELGNVAVRTDPQPIGLFTGYLRDENATAGRFKNGWYFTGDRAKRDRDGYIWFEGREDDVITSSAYRIGPFEVESALIEHPAVAEAAVVGRPDAMRTEIVCAFVILAPGFEASTKLLEELQEHTKKVTAPYKFPREIHFVKELPKTVSGKIRRTELRDWLKTQIPPGIEWQST